MPVLAVQMVGSGAKKAQKIHSRRLTPLSSSLFFIFLHPFLLHTASLLSEHLEQATDLGVQFQVNLQSILSSNQISQFILSSKALSCMVPYLFRGMVYFFKSFLAYWEIMCIVSNIFCSVSSFMLKRFELW